MKTEYFQHLSYPQTPQTASQWFRDHGICIAHWARHFGYSRYTVTDLLRGMQKGRWGESHRVAVALGLKPDPDRSAP
jgi:gp16 family phage-associated protein